MSIVSFIKSKEPEEPLKEGDWINRSEVEVKCANDIFLKREHFLFLKSDLVVGVEDGDHLVY